MESQRRRSAMLLAVGFIMLLVGSPALACGGVDDEFPETTTTDPTTSVPAEVSSNDDAVADATAEVVEGRITHDVPAEMVEGETYAIVVRVGSQESAEEFEAAIEASGATLGESERQNIDSLPRVTPEMQVILAAPPSFEISEENSRLQALGEDGVARWGYQIQPTEPGEHEVRITAEIVVGDSVETLEPVYDGSVDVAVASGGFLDDLGSRLNPVIGVLVVLATLASGIAGIIVVREHAARNRAASADSPGSDGSDQTE